MRVRVRQAEPSGPALAHQILLGVVIRMSKVQEVIATSLVIEGLLRSGLTTNLSLHICLSAKRRIVEKLGRLVLAITLRDRMSQRQHDSGRTSSIYLLEYREQRKQLLEMKAKKLITVRACLARGRPRSQPWRHACSAYWLC